MTTDLKELSVWLSEFDWSVVFPLPCFPIYSAEAYNQSVQVAAATAHGKSQTNIIIILSTVLGSAVIFLVLICIVLLCRLGSYKAKLKTDTSEPAQVCNNTRVRLPGMPEGDVALINLSAAEGKAESIDAAGGSVASAKDCIDMDEVEDRYDNPRKRKKRSFSMKYPSRSSLDRHAYKPLPRASVVDTTQSLPAVSLGKNELSLSSTDTAQLQDDLAGPQTVPEKVYATVSRSAPDSQLHAAQTADNSSDCDTSAYHDALSSTTDFLNMPLPPPPLPPSPPITLP